jgi:tetratricopeptide (TPR) repeat protein
LACSSWTAAPTRAAWTSSGTRRARWRAARAATALELPAAALELLRSDAPWPAKPMRTLLAAAGASPSGMERRELEAAAAALLAERRLAAGPFALARPPPLTRVCVAALPKPAPAPAAAAPAAAAPAALSSSGSSAPSSPTSDAAPTQAAAAADQRPPRGKGKAAAAAAVTAVAADSDEDPDTERATLARKADAAKARGNECFARGDFEKATAHYSIALRLRPGDAVLHSNRSAAHCSLARWGEAMRDANACIELLPAWPKGHCRKGAALVGMGQPVEAIKCFRAALAAEPGYGPAAEALREATEAIRAQQAGAR